MAHGEYFFRMACRECNHPTEDSFHDLCRGHAYCARGPQYFSAPCAVCEDLWDRARDLDRPQDAMAAFKALKYWIYGFRKNSRHRPKGLGHFYSEQERVDFQELNSIHANLQATADSDSHAASSKSKVRMLSFVHVLVCQLLGNYFVCKSSDF